MFEAVDAIATAQGDDCDAVGDLRGVGGRKGDVVVDLDGCSGRPRGRIVFEAKNSKRSRNEALAELDEAMNQRAADYAVWVVPSEDKLPARAPALREVNGDKLFVVYDPEEGSRLALEVAYSLARARVVMAKGGADGSTRPPCAPRSSARRSRWRTSAGSRASSRAPPTRSRTCARSSRQWRARARPPRADRRAGRPGRRLIPPLPHRKHAGCRHPRTQDLPEREEDMEEHEREPAPARAGDPEARHPLPATTTPLPPGSVNQPRG